MLSEAAKLQLKTSPGGYKCDDRSRIAQKLTTFWKWVTFLLPEWVAPNVITLTGVGLSVLSCLLSLWYSPNLSGGLPWFVHIFNAVSMFAFQTMDAMDGIQARRTGAGSALGDFLDHSVDFMAISSGALVQVITLGLGNSLRGLWVAYFALWAIAINHFTLSWETKHTNLLVLEDGSSITEGQIVMMFMSLFTMLVGDGFWQFKFFFFTLGEIWICLALGVLCIRATIISITRVGSLGDPIPKFSQLIPLVSTAILHLAFCWDKLEHHREGVLFSIIFSECLLSGPIFIDRLTKGVEPYTWKTMIAVPLVFLGALMNFPYSLGLINNVLFAGNALYYVLIIKEMATALDVPILTVRPKKATKTQ